MTKKEKRKSPKQRAFSLATATLTSITLPSMMLDFYNHK